MRRIDPLRASKLETDEGEDIGLLCQNEYKKSMGIIEESVFTELQLGVLLKAQKNLCGILKKEREQLAKERGERKEDWWREEWNGLGVSSHREPDRNW